MPSRCANGSPRRATIPSFTIGPLLDSHQHDIAATLRESLEAEGQALDLYRQLLRLVEGKLVGLEEFARQMIQAKKVHAAEVDKMLRKPGEVASFAPRADQRRSTVPA
jgi:bacterioferritin